MIKRQLADDSVVPLQCAAVTSHADITEPMTRKRVMDALHHAFTRPECVKGGLHVEIHIGRKQAEDMFGAGSRSWPRPFNGQPCYLVDSGSLFRIEPRGTYKKQQS